MMLPLELANEDPEVRRAWLDLRLICIEKVRKICLTDFAIYGREPTRENFNAVVEAAHIRDGDVEAAMWSIWGPGL